MAPRILSALTLLFSVLYMPFWFSILLALFFTVYFRIFWEAPTMFLLSDLLFGFPAAKFFNIVFVPALASAIVVMLAEFVKKKLKFY